RGDAPDQFLEQRQGQATAGLAVGRRGHTQAGDADQVVDGHIAVEDLGEEQVDERHGVQGAVPPGVPDVAAGVEELGAIEWSSRRVPEVPKDRKNPWVHRGSLLVVDFLYHLYGRERCFVQVIAETRLGEIP